LQPTAALPAAAPGPAPVSAAAAAAKILTPTFTASPKAGTVFGGTNAAGLRLSNTRKTIGQLTGERHALLLANAFIDTEAGLDIAMPEHLRPQGDPGAYIVQARGPMDGAFRGMLAGAGVEIVAYIPNDAYLVRATEGVAEGLAANALTQAVTPYEPYYKIQSSLLLAAVGQMQLPDGAQLNVGLFPGSAAAAIPQIEKLGGKIVSQGGSPFGPVVRVVPPKNWTVLATLPGVQFVERYHPRMQANDLSRVATGVTPDTLVATNYLNLTGSNVMVEVNDSGIDATHPDFTAGGTVATRIFGAPTTDTAGHGTHVAGIIAGDGTESTTVTNASGSILTFGLGTGTNGQFRG
jgi:subtilisin family serine protease